MAIVETQDLHLPTLPLASNPIDPKTLPFLYFLVFVHTRDQQPVTRYRQPVFPFFMPYNR
jgi:hypothetical protein